MSIDTLQKASLAALVWVWGVLFTRVKVYEILWPRERRLAALMYHTEPYGIDVAPPIPLVASITIYALPTILLGLLVALYRNRGRP